MRRIVIATTLLLLAGAAHASTPAIPDSVLAVVGPGRTVTVATFAQGWRRVSPPERPDSLTPEGARRFLDLLVGKELLAAAAGREHWEWTARERADFDALRDHLVIQAMLDSAMEVARRELKSAGYDTHNRDTLGIVARDSAMARMHVRFDDALAGRLARAWAAIPRPSRDSSIFAQLRVLGTMPTVEPADTARVLAHASSGDYTVSDLLGSWYRLNPMYRPHIETPSQIEDLARNGLFERLLRRQAAERHVVERPAIAGQLARQRELNDVTHYVEREVSKATQPDSSKLRAFYREHQAVWALPLRVRVTRLTLPDKSSATRMALALRDPARADSLVAQARRSGLDWTAEVSEASDSAMFKASLTAGVGTVFGPDTTDHGWAVTRVMAIVPGRVRPFGEVVTLVEHAWITQQSELRVRSLLAELRERTPVRINDAAIARLVQDPPPGLTSAR